MPTEANGTRATRLQEKMRTLPRQDMQEASYTVKDVSNALLSAKTAQLGISVLNAMENNVNVFARWMLFSAKQTPDLKTVNEYTRVLEDHANEINKFTKAIKNDYKGK